MSRKLPRMRLSQLIHPPRRIVRGRSLTTGHVQHIHRSPLEGPETGRRVSCSPRFLTGGFRQPVIFGGVDLSRTERDTPVVKRRGRWLS